MALDLSGHPVLERKNKKIQARMEISDNDVAILEMFKTTEYMVDQYIKEFDYSINLKENSSKKIYELRHNNIINDDVYIKWTEIRERRNPYAHDKNDEISESSDELARACYSKLLDTEKFFIEKVPRENTCSIPYEYLTTKEKREYIKDKLNSFHCIRQFRIIKDSKGKYLYQIECKTKNFPERELMERIGWTPANLGARYNNILKKEIFGGETFLCVDYIFPEEKMNEQALRLIRYWEIVNNMSENEIRARIAEPWLDEQKRQKELREQQRKENEERQKEYAKNLKKGAWRYKIRSIFDSPIGVIFGIIIWVVIVMWIGKWGIFSGDVHKVIRERERAAEMQQELEQKQLLEKQLKEKKENAIREYTYADSFDTSVVKEPVDTWYHTGDLGTELGVGDVGYYNYEFTYIKDGGKEKAQVPVYYMLRNVKHGEDAISFLEDVNLLLRSDFRYEYIDNENFDKDKYEFVVAEFSVDDTEIYKYADKSEKIDSDSSYFRVRALDDKNWKDSSSTYKFGRCDLSMCSNHTPGECYSVYHIFCYEKGYDNYALSGGFGTHQWDKYCIPKSVVIG